MKVYNGTFNKLILSSYFYLYSIGKNHFHNIISNYQKKGNNRVSIVNSLSIKNISSVDLKKDYYSTLMIKPNANQKEIREAYLNLVKKYHPDLTKKSESAEQFKEISNSFQILSNEKRKKFYDENSGRFLSNENSGCENYEAYKPKESTYYSNSYEDFFDEERRRRNYEKMREDFKNNNLEKSNFHYRQASIKCKNVKEYDYEKNMRIIDFAFFVPKVFFIFTLYMLYKYIESKIRMNMI